MEKVFFDGFESLARVLVTVPLAYAGIVLFIRINGKRSTSQMNNFDWIVTVGMGTIFASCITMQDVVLVNALGAVALLLAIQFAVTTLSVRSEQVERLLKASPTLLVYRGEYQLDAMRDERVSDQEVRAAVRDAGFSRMEDVGAVVLESDASFSVLGTAALDLPGGPDVLSELRRAEG